jgi:hypothetical protein
MGNDLHALVHKDRQVQVLKCDRGSNDTKKGLTELNDVSATLILVVALLLTSHIACYHGEQQERCQQN